MKQLLQRLLLPICVAVLAGCATQPPDHQLARTSQDAAITSRTIDLLNPPQDMWDRIRRGFAIPNLYDSYTDQWTQYYAEHARSVYRMSERASRYLYYIVEEIEQRGLPTELALLPFVESAYNPTAYSRAKASGLWQFIPSTGKHYNLQQDRWRDQRRDPIASTHAALDYLSYLYDFQGDWYLALASYNWGEGAVRRAMQRNEKAGQDTDYLSLRMPAETRNYVPKLQAIKNLIADPARYGITLPIIENEPYFTTIVLADTPSLSISDAARLAEMSEEDFQALNASFNHPVILAEHQHTLLLPKDKAHIFQYNLQNQAHTLNEWKTYQTKKGESYSSIAKKFDVTLEQLRTLNGISKRQTRAVAQTLVVPGKAAPTGGLRLASHDPSDNTTAPARAQPSTAPQGQDIVVRRSPTVRTHTVQRGETLYSLARRYQTSVDALRKLNNIKGNSLRQGARLRVPGTQVRG